MASIIRSFHSSGERTRTITGDTKISFTEFDHLGWLKCDGRLLTVSDYMSLYKVIGHRFGGSGNQFKLPDMRGRVAGAAGIGPIRDDANRLLTERTKGDYLGEEIHQLTIGELASHNHGTDATDLIPGNNLTSVNGIHTHSGTALTAGAHVHTIGDIPQGTQDVTNISGGATAAEEVRYTGTTSSAGNHEHTLSIVENGNHQHTIVTQGNNTPHNNMQPTLFLGNMFIYCNKPYEGAGPLAAGTDII